MKQYIIQFMTKAERRTISVSCDWFSVYTINKKVCLVYESTETLTGEVIIDNLLSWSLSSYPASEDVTK